MTLRQTIIKARKDNGISQKSLSERCGIRQATLCDFERGKTSIGSDTLEKLMSILGLELVSK